jgi:hypothetical protein
MADAFTAIVMMAIGAAIAASGFVTAIRVHDKARAA